MISNLNQSGPSEDLTQASDGGAVEEAPEVIRRYRVGRGVGRSDRTIPAPLIMNVMFPDDQLPLSGVRGGGFFVLFSV